MVSTWCFLNFGSTVRLTVLTIRNQLLYCLFGFVVKGEGAESTKVPMRVLYYLSSH